VLANVPTTGESGIPSLSNFEVIGWVGLLAPKSTPKPVIDLLNESVMQIVQDKEIKEKLNAQGLEIPAPHPPEQFKEFLRDQMVKWDAAARAAKIPRE